MSTLHLASDTFVRKVAGTVRRYPTLHTLCSSALYATHAVRSGFWKEIVGLPSRNGKRQRQQVLDWDVALPAVKDSAELAVWLQSRGIRICEGSNALYIPPQEALESVIPALVRFYPPNSGFKILKDFRPPAEANYLVGNSGHNAVRTRLTGRPEDQLVTANYMHRLGIGPRIWDVCCWRGAGAAFTVFVVDHLDGGETSELECGDFVAKLERLVEETLLGVLVPNWRRKSDFLPPNCNHNLLRSASGDPQYVDFQNFRISSPDDWARQIIDRAKADLHFGDSRPWRGGRYLYQSIPGVSGGGKRDTNKRWAFITDCLEKVQFDLKGRVAMDIGCNSGMILQSCLAAGAGWALGWDRPAVIEHARQLLFSLGSGRFSLFGGELHPAYRLEDDIPDNLTPNLTESIVFYLSVRQHIGLLESLRRIPWRVLIYEGHQREYIDDDLEILAPLLADGVRCVATSRIADGDSGSRPIAVLVRD